MTVSSQTNNETFDGNGVTTIWDLPFRFFNNSDIFVYLIDPVSQVSTLLALGTDYTLTGAGLPEQFGTSPGKITTITPVANGKQLYVERVMDVEQLTDIVNQGRFFPEVHEDVFDRLTMFIQQAFAGLKNALTLDKTGYFWDFRGKRGINAADPVNAQDVATKNWVGLFIDSVSGLINTTVGIAYDAGTLFDYLRYGVGRQVDSVAALRLLAGSRNQRAFVLGYYAKGDGGGGAYYIDSADTTSADNGGTIIVAADGARWKLSRTGRVSVLQFGAKQDPAFDSYTSIYNAHLALKSVYYPSGKVYCGQHLLITGEFGIQGDGLNKSFIVFNGATQGIKVTQQTADQGISVKDLSFHTTIASTTTVGLLIDGTPQLGASDGAGHLILNDRTQNRVTVRNVDFRGVTDGAGWGINLQFLSVMNFSTYNVTWRGMIPAVVGNLQGVGILVNGDGVPVDFSIDRTWGYYTLYSILLPDYVEGGHIRNYEFVACTYGIIGRYTPGYSVLPEAATGCLSMYIGDGHLNVLQAGIILAKTNQTHIRDQNIYLQPRAADAPALGIQISGGNWNDVDGIFISGDSAANVKANNLGLVMTNMGLSSASKIKASSVKSSVTLQGSTGNRIINCLAAFCTNVIDADAGSTSNDLSGKGQSLTGVKFSVPLDNNIIMEEYAGFASRTLSAGATATISITMPVGLFTEAPRFATMSIDVSTIYYKWQYLRSSSSASQITFLLAAAAPASSVPAETIEVSVNAKGI